MSDDDFVEGNSDSAAADAPGAIPSDDAPVKAPQGSGFDSLSATDAPVQARSKTAARHAAARKAFAEKILEDKNKPAPPSADGEYDPEADASKPAAVAQDLAAAKVAAADAPPPAAAPAIPVLAAPPPAPSLDPEVRKLREQLAADRKAFEAERAEWGKQKETERPVDALSFETYLDSTAKAHRNWLESMRGEKFASDDEFKAEVRDVITSLSTDVLGVPLPDNVPACVRSRTSPSPESRCTRAGRRRCRMPASRSRSQESPLAPSAHGIDSIARCRRSTCLAP
jgi:hypothetical protein